VIEGLKLGDAAIRKVAISRLEAWTGQFLGFFADDPPEKRAAAVASWERWWAEEGKKFAADSVRATIRKDEVTEDEKQLGLADWVRAQKAWDAIAEASPPLTGEARRAELEKVRFLLRKALESYPQCVNARLSLGILEYIELGELDAGAREIETVLTRYADEGGRPAKVLAYFHLGRIAEMQKRWLDADRCYRQARSLDPRNAEVLRALGALDYDRALRDDSLSAEERKRAFAEAIDLFTTAIQAVDEREIEVGDSVRSAGAATEEMPFRRDAFVRSLENAKQELTRLAAELRYLRGRARAALQRDEEAYQDFVAARELAPENPLYRGAADKWRPAPARQDPEKPRFRPEDVK
jgi:tetratricopeptide (TPR) repeat protein